MDEIEVYSEQSKNITDSFQEVSERLLKRRNVSTDKSKVKERRGKGGQTWSYIDRITALEWLDEYYPGWSMEVSPDYKEYIGNLYIKVKITVPEIIEKQVVTRIIECWGSDELIVDKTGTIVDGPYLKSAETDALKRCVFSLGGFKDVYTGEEVKQSAIDDNEILWVMSSLKKIVKDDMLKLYNSISMYSRGKLSKSYIEQKLKEIGE